MIEEILIASTFLECPNSLCPTIQLTMELEKDRSLPFQETFLTSGGDASINNEVYCKTPHPDQYLQYIFTILSMSKEVWPHACAIVLEM